MTPITFRCRSWRGTIFRTRTAVSGVDIPPNIRHEVLFNEVLSFRAVLDGNTRTGKLAAAEDNILLDESVVTAMNCHRPFQAIVYRVADELELISGICRIWWAPEMVRM